MRWLVDGEWPFMQPEVQLAGALRQRCAWLLTEPLALDIDPGCADMVPSDVPAVVDVAELMLLAAAPECCPVRAHLAVRGEPQLIELTLTVAATGDEPMGDLEAAREALRDLAGALGTVAHTENGTQQWRVRIALRHWGGMTRAGDWPRNGEQPVNERSSESPLESRLRPPGRPGPQPTWPAGTRSRRCRTDARSIIVSIGAPVRIALIANSIGQLAPS